MDEGRMAGVLMVMGDGRLYSESWLTNHAKCTLEQLDELVELGKIRRIDKNPQDTMSDNRYMITEAGKEFSRRRHVLRAKEEKR